MKNTPSFQYYPADLIADTEVMFWDAEAVGAYWLLINFLWLNGGHFELNFDKLRQIFRKKTRKSAQNLWKKIENKFELCGNVVTHKRVSEEMQKQAAYRLMKEKAGRVGGQKRKQNYDSAKEKTVADYSSSTSSSSSTSKREKESPLPPFEYSEPKEWSSDIREITEYWADQNGTTPGGREYEQWSKAIGSHKVKACKYYINDIKSTSPGVIITRMDFDSADKKGYWKAKAQSGHSIRPPCSICGSPSTKSICDVPFCPDHNQFSVTPTTEAV